MKIKELTATKLREELGLAVLNEAEPQRTITCGYTGDLLSWVMGRAPADSAWVTVMSNVNVVAVATLADVGCVILAEGAELDTDALEKARTAGVNVYSSPLPAFDICSRLAAM